MSKQETENRVYKEGDKEYNIKIEGDRLLLDLPLDNGLCTIERMSDGKAYAILVMDASKEIGVLGACAKLQNLETSYQRFLEMVAERSGIKVCDHIPEGIVKR